MIKNLKLKRQNIYLYALNFNLIICFLFDNKSLNINSILLFTCIFAVDIIIILLSIRKMNLKLNEIMIIIFFLSGQLIAYTWSMIQELPVDFDIHRIIVSLALIISFYFIAMKNPLSENNMCKIFNIFIVTGVISLFYDLFLNFTHIVSMFSDIMILKYNGYYFTSFFAQRTECAYHSFLCCSCCIYLITKTKKKMYYIAYIVNLGHIILTGARMPLAASLVIAVMMFGIDDKFRKNVRWILLCLLFVIILNYETVQNFYSSFVKVYLSHTGSTGIDTGIGRINAWKDLWINTDIISFFFGRGMGAQSTLITYYSPDYTAGGYHSMYVDAFCQGGILYLGIILFSIISMTRKICNGPMNLHNKTFTCALAFSYCISLLTDSVGSLYDFQVFSMMSTSLVIGIPLARLCYERVSNNHVKTGEIIT